MSEIQEKILRERLIAVVVFNEESEVSPVIESLLEGGISIIELALRTEYSIEAVAKVMSEYPEMTAGIGTVITPEQVFRIKELGVPFAVAPGLNRKVLDAADKVGLEFYPGITTPSEIESALEYGKRIMKYFTAEPSGGMPYLKSINAPYAHLGIKYIPLGGVNPANLKSYLDSDIIGAVGGSWIAPRKLIAAGDWKTIREQAAEAVAIKKSCD